MAYFRKLRDAGTHHFTVRLQPEIGLNVRGAKKGQNYWTSDVCKLRQAELVPPTNIRDGHSDWQRETSRD